jgi:hypothetical protein
MPPRTPSPLVAAFASLAPSRFPRPRRLHASAIRRDRLDLFDLPGSAVQCPAFSVPARHQAVNPALTAGRTLSEKWHKRPMWSISRASNVALP